MGQQKVDNFGTITVVNHTEIVRVCFECIYNKLLITKFDDDIIIEKLNSSCQIYISYSSYYEKIRKNAKNGFQFIKDYFTTTMTPKKNLTNTYVPLKMKKENTNGTNMNVSDMGRFFENVLTNFDIINYE